jgi:hypothetical protein
MGMFQGVRERAKHVARKQHAQNAFVQQEPIARGSN